MAAIFWAPSWILPKVSNRSKNIKELEICDAGHVEYDIIENFAFFTDIFCFPHLKTVKNTNFSSKMA